MVVPPSGPSMEVSRKGWGDVLRDGVQDDTGVEEEACATPSFSSVFAFGRHQDRTSRLFRRFVMHARTHTHTRRMH